jgi:glutathione reductase (NADPH)
VEKPRFDWASLIANKDKEIDRLNAAYKRTLANAKAELIEARAGLVDRNTVSVGGRKVSAEVILIATGSWPELPKIPGIEHAISSNECFHLAKLPQRVVVVGGGYIALEFAGIFNGLGADTTVLYRGEQVLRGFDNDVRNFLSEELTKKDIKIRCKADVSRIDKTGDALRLTLLDGSTIDCDILLYATGRRPLTRNMGLDKVGVTLDELGAVKVNASSQTSVPNIYAVGDCTNRINLTPVAIREGHAFADSVFGKQPWQVDHADCPSAVFTQPPVGSVGLSEEAARAKFGTVDIYRASFRPMKHTMTGRTERALMKLVIDRKSQVVVGAHMVGGDAPEIIQTLAIAVKLKATKQQIDQTIAVHPTAAEEFVTMHTPVAAE